MLSHPLPELHFSAPRSAIATRLMLVLLALACLLWLGVRTASAAVDLVSFTGAQEDDWARLDWLTATEIENAGFFVQRSASGGSDPANYAPIEVVDVDTGQSTTYIAPRGDSLIGAAYAFYDQAVNPGETYFYLLETVDNNNFSEFHGPLTVTITLDGAPTPSPTLGTETPTPTTTLTANTPSPTITGSPTRTSPPPSPTASRTPTRTLAPTATQTPSVTPTSGPSATPTITFTPPTQTQTLLPIDASLTALLENVPPYPTATATRPPPRTRPTRAPTATDTPIPSETGFLEGASVAGLLRLGFTALVLVGSGGILSLGLLLANRSKDSTQDE